MVEYLFDVRVKKVYVTTKKDLHEFLKRHVKLLPAGQLHLEKFCIIDVQKKKI